MADPLKKGTSMTDFTPGPWCLGDSDLPVSQLSINGHVQGRKHSTIARVVNPDFVGMDVIEGLANANLIKAAPDLYEALAEFLESHSIVPTNAHDLIYDRRDRAFAQARAALSKARGE